MSNSTNASPNTSPKNTSHGGAAHGSIKEYVIGLVLSIVLTVIPFGMVMSGTFSGGLTLAIVLLCLIAQVFVQLVFFLHMNGSSEQVWNTTSGVFIVLIVLIVVLGSIWIMAHLNHNMLLGH
jgi:cytochrome o ubiquinol oxidase operon protein cyoD